jgi:hypothetical protein
VLKARMARLREFQRWLRSSAWIHCAARDIQTAWRCYYQTQRYQRTLAAIVKVQSFGRMVIAAKLDDLDFVAVRDLWHEELYRDLDSAGRLTAVSYTDTGRGAVKVVNLKRVSIRQELLLETYVGVLQEHYRSKRDAEEARARALSQPRLAA